MPFVSEKDLYTVVDGKKVLKPEAEKLCLKLAQITFDPTRDWSKKGKKQNVLLSDEMLEKNLKYFEQTLLENPALITVEEYKLQIVDNMLANNMHFSDTVLDMLKDDNFARALKSVKNIGFDALDYNAFDIALELIKDPEFLRTHFDENGKNIPMYMLVMAQDSYLQPVDYMPFVKCALMDKEARLHQDSLGDNLASVAVDAENKRVLKECLKYEDLREQNTSLMDGDKMSRTFVDDAVEMNVLSQEEVDVIIQKAEDTQKPVAPKQKATQDVTQA